MKNAFKWQPYIYHPWRNTFTLAHIVNASSIVGVHLSNSAIMASSLVDVPSVSSSVQELLPYPTMNGLHLSCQSKLEPHSNDHD